MVVDIQNDPMRIHQFMQESGAVNYNILLQDGDHDRLPPGKPDVQATDVGNWLWELFQYYSAEPQTFRLKFFDDIALSLVKKNRGIQSPPVTYSLCTVTVDTDGELKQADTFRINEDGADQLEERNILDSSLHELADSPANRAYLNVIENLALQCLNCSYLGACGGGYPQHRYKAGDYMQPSVYCADYLHLFERMEAALCH
jgi:uncharacterized protein